MGVPRPRFGVTVPVGMFTMTTVVKYPFSDGVVFPGIGPP